MQAEVAAGSGGSSRSWLYEKHDIVSFFLGKRSLLVLRMASCHAGRSGSRDRRKLEELAVRKTRHRVVFSWQTQFAGAAHGILPCRQKWQPGSAEARGA
jgi:hypothetical protein